METTYDTDTLYTLIDDRGRWHVAAGRDLLADRSLSRDYTVRVATLAEARADAVSDEGWGAGWTCADGITSADDA